jgi:hypothetical protein
MSIPAHASPIYEGGKIVNKGPIPLWSGKGRVPDFYALDFSDQSVASLRRALKAAYEEGRRSVAKNAA